MRPTCRSNTALRASRNLAEGLAFVVLTLVAGGAAAQTAGTPVNGVILRVNDRVVTLFDYRERLAERQRAITGGRMPEEQRQQRLTAAPADVLRELLDENLLLSRGDQLAVEVEDERLERALQNARRNFGMENEAQFEAAMAQTGMTRDEFRARVRDQLVYQEVLGREVHSKIEIKEEELLRLYRERPADFTTPAETHLREFVVLEEGGGSAAEREALAAQLAAQVRAGTAMAEAVAESAAAGRTSGAIDLGWVRAGDLDPALERAVADLEAGQLSAPVAGRGGVHVLQVVERRAAKLRPFSEVKQELEDLERMRRFQAELETYMDRLEEHAYIVADPPAEAANFRRATPAEPELRELLAPVTPPAAPPTVPPPAANSVP